MLQTDKIGKQASKHTHTQTQQRRNKRLSQIAYPIHLSPVLAPQPFLPHSLHVCCLMPPGFAPVFRSYFSIFCLLSHPLLMYPCHKCSFLCSFATPAVACFLLLVCVASFVVSPFASVFWSSPHFVSFRLCSDFIHSSPSRVQTYTWLQH